ncbi:after-VIT domain-containing protein [Anabaena cylindrica FACHB-243]|uniref:Vault protein inter-alpha-trypsin domain-containing protein n=1 Tax=Anabaena cylindrica (strain ATCC 27899 / PCC 7122) TaxID=272123 RepID=K9ZM71_ANACC|nr:MULTISPECIES: VIT domain-containing protein [Anabaena]AFZ60286.1 Vault protein inter-alpha-trypsin domain-containing protein [Anabaena cylindrica PCC 7122]MBD2417662.1 after-VIT domain-containing protein [Anabaena cylindrica FACHB-243]MBY5282055.1 after-VIT domain-containing protein [Anabaena sp. CCAP 1446/1C]MBY5308893.1 after-VIT domain-containing protein [Anabaena sp. CCAP 1446/1C]MCM2404577.1 after-VIT domain-containing protein [Anabaena sp. CCAP 1446/1C]
MISTLEQQPSGLYIYTPNQQPIAFPLKHTEVKAQVVGNISRVEVTQSFENPFTTTLEATYIFPLPDEAAVDDMLIRIGDKMIKGSIKKRQEAQQIYEQAKQQGRTAGLLEQERDNIFTQSLANIQPGEQIDVIIRYTESLKFEGGNYEFVFPMVVGPRYIPGISIEDNTAGRGSAPAPMSLNQDTDLVPDASRLNAPILPAGTRSSHDINVTVEINAGVEIGHINSPSHHIQITRDGNLAQIQLGGGDTIPNKDLILRYQVAGENTQTSVLTQADERGGHFAVYLIPALQYQPDQFVPKDMVFLIDRSGSQSGAPLMQCQELMRRFIAGLNPHDTFSIIDFCDTTQQLSPVPLVNTPENRLRAINYINRLNAGGGTQMLRGIQTVLNFPVTDPVRLRNIVLLTDGYIGNENQIIAEVQRCLQPGTRLHSFGAGSSVNRFLLNRVAEIGRGIARIIRHDEPMNEVVEKFFRQINHPVFANIQLHWEGDGEFPIMYPSTPPDLFAEQPLVLFGRKPDGCAGKLHVTGMSGDGRRSQYVFNINFQVMGNPAIAQLWGRSRIKDLMNQMVSGDTKVGVEAVTNTALTYQLLSQYTAFVAVSDEVRVHPYPASVSMQVPVEMPAGVSQQGIFGNAVPGGMVTKKVTRRESLSRPQPSMYAAPAPESLAKDEFSNLETVLFEPEMSAKRATRSEPLLDDESINLFADMPEGSLNEGSLDEPRGRGYPAASIQQPINNAETEELEELKALLEGDEPAPRLQVVKIKGLTRSMIYEITHYLQSIALPEDMSGELVFEFQINQGRVRQLVLDEQASSVTKQSLIELIKRSLLTWRPSQIITSSVVLTIQIQS